MKLYLNGTLIHPAAGAADIELVVAALRRKPRAPLELRRDAATSIRAAYEPGVGYFVEVEDPKARYGWLAGEEGGPAVVAAFADFLEGSSPRPAGSRPADGTELVEVISGNEFEPDCPLCAAAMAR